MKLLFRYLGILFWGLPLSGVSGQELNHATAMKEGLNLFKNEVRGILNQHCIECHGQNDLKGDFDLSTRELLFESGFVGGSAAESDMVDFITHRFEPYMPHEKDKLDEVSIDSIVRWIDLGAPYDKPLVKGAILRNQGPLEVTEKDREYWAYRQLKKPDIPDVENDLWVRNEIDHFVSRRLEENGLSPQEEVKRRTLIRRIYFNALGLPPSPNEVAVYVGDFNPWAYERLVDRVLNSKHFGERWARHWMDLARFGETMGFETDFDRPYAYHYRDFLIRAFNKNMPYDQFVSWQVAGDKITEEDPLALMATGFLGAGVISTVITEKEFESARYDELDDIVSTIGVAFLGTTIGCARCHDHKYDPIPAKDYYQLVSNFTRTVRTYIDLDPFADQFETQIAKFNLEKERLNQELDRYEASVIEPRYARWLKDRAFDIPDDRWIVLSPETFSSLQGAKMDLLWDESVLVQSQFIDTDKENLFFEFETSLQNLTALRMETLTHPLLPNRGPGSDYEGGFTLFNLIVEVQDLSLEEPKWKKVELESAMATSEKNDQMYSAQAIFSHVTQGWSISEDALGKDQAIVIRFKEPLRFHKSTRIRIKLSSGLNLHQMVGRPRFSVTHDWDAPVEVSDGVSSLAYQAMLKLFVGRKSETLLEIERDALLKWFAREDPGWQIIWREIQEHELNRPKAQKLRIMAATDSLRPIWHRSAVKGFPSFYDDTYFLKRGDADQKGAIAPPGYLQVLQRKGSHTMLDSGRNTRKRFAGWLTDVEVGAGGLLARVFVNRVWYHYFGRGIVETPNDFGRQGGNPSHPELLEWLATDFVEHGWDIKRLHHQILTSATFRQGSKFVAEKSNIDVHNRLLWRYAPRRFEAELIRDSLLHVSGLLDRTQFGPGSRDSEMLRRSIYFYIKRSALMPEMVLFDWPEHLVSIGRRASTTIASQALQFLNSPQTQKYAKGFSQRLTALNDIDELICQAYLIAFGRFPKCEEIELGKEFLTTQASSYREKGYDPNLAIVDYCQSLFSLNEFVYIR